MDTFIFIVLVGVLIVAGIVATIINLTLKDRDNKDEPQALLGVVHPKKKEDK